MRYLGLSGSKLLFLVGAMNRGSRALTKQKQVGKAMGIFEAQMEFAMPSW
jgi:hypothetical protein